MKRAGQISVMLLVALMLHCTTAQSAYLRNIPRTVVQPSGDSVECFITGDEFYRRLHDADGYTIIKDQQTRYWVYAEYSNDKAVPSAKIVGRDQPDSNSLKRGASPLTTDYQVRIDDFQKILDESKAPTLGIMNNLSVFIRFADDSEFTTAREVFEWSSNNDEFYNDVSLRNYYRHVSREQLLIETTFYPLAASDTNISYRDSHNRDYYQPFDSTDNENGYEDYAERMTREQTLLNNAIMAVKAQIPPELNIDGDSDGFVDNVTFVVRGGTDDWGDLLWPHRYQMYDYTININGANVLDYNFQIEWAYTVSVLCHEMFHSMGSPDLYHYDSAASYLNPVGGWDLMEWSANPPQYIGAYMQYKYGKWIDSIPVISETGIYKLNALGMADSNAYRINSPYSMDEYFVVEFRTKNWDIFERSLPKIGMLIYRINSTVHGNAEGPPDEVYIFRPDGTLDIDGRIDDANFNPGYGRTAINDTTNPSTFLSDGSAGGLNICAVGNITNNSINFRLGTWLEGDIYDGHGGPLTSTNGPHYIAFDITVPTGQTLTIEPGTIAHMAPRRSIIAQGTLIADGSSNSVQFLESFVEQSARLIIDTKMRLQNGAVFQLLKYVNK